MNNNRFIELYKSTAKQELLAVLFFALILCCIRFSLFQNFNTHLYGGLTADAGLYWWLFQQNLDYLFSEAWFNTKGFYPYTKTLAWSDNFILPALLGKVFSLLTSKIAAYNLILLLANFLNGYFTYRLALLLSGKFLASLLSGTAFFAYAFLTNHLGHPQLQFAFWLPLSLIFLFKAFQQKKLINSISLGLTCFLSFLTSVYYTFFILILLELIVIAILLQKPKSVKIKDYGKIFSGFTIGFFPIIFFVLPYLDVKATFGERQIYEPSAFAANLLSYFSAPVNNLFYKATSSFSHPEAQLFGGVVIIIFAVVAYFRAFGIKRLNLQNFLLLFTFIIGSLFSLNGTNKENYLTAIFLWLSLITFIWTLIKLGRLERKLKYNFFTNRNFIASFLFAAFCFYFFSFGPLGRGDQEYTNWGLYSLYYHLFPGVSAIRAVGRAGIVVFLLLSLTIPFVINYLKKSGFINNKILVLLVVLVFVENYITKYPLELPEDKPPVFSQLKSIANKDDVVLVLPFTKELKENETVKSWSNFATYNTRYLNWVHTTGLQTLNGYSGQRSKIILEYPRKFSNFPDERSLTTLSLIPNLKYVVYLSNYNLKQKNLQEEIKNFPELKLLGSDITGASLFSYQGITDLSNSYFLQVPSYPAGQKLKLELKIENTKEASIPLQIFIKKHFENIPYITLSLSNTQDWKTYEILTPETIDSVRPLFFTFAPPEGTKIFLRNKWITQK